MYSGLSSTTSLQEGHTEAQFGHPIKLQKPTEEQFNELLD
jgi:hypothetical protein